MSTWTPDELERLATAEEVRVASARADGSLRRPVIVWMVRSGNDVYVRSVRGRDGSWFRGVQDRHVGQVDTRGLVKDVTFVEVDGPAEELDAAYRAKYRRYAGPVLDSVLTPQARAATLRVDPQP